MGRKKIGDAAWDDCVALCLVTVLTTVTKNREQEVMLSSPVSLAPQTVEQSECHLKTGPHIGKQGLLFRILPNKFNHFDRTTKRVLRVKSTYFGGNIFYLSLVYLLQNKELR